MGRPKYRTVTVGAVYSTVDKKATSEILNGVDWKISVFDPRYNFAHEWVDTWLEIDITVERLEWDDIEEDILEAGWSMV